MSQEIKQITDENRNTTAFHLDGYPDAVAALRIETAKSKRLSDLRVHQRTIQHCREGLERFTSNLDKNLAELVIFGAATKFFSCFGYNNAGMKLEADKIFQHGTIQRKVFEYWRSIRDHFIAHDLNTYSQSFTVLIAGKNNDFIDVNSIVVTAELSEEDISNLFNLIRFTEDWLAQSINAALASVIVEAKSLSSDEIASLEPMIYTTPFSPDQMKNENKKKKRR